MCEGITDGGLLLAPQGERREADMRHPQGASRRLCVGLLFAYSQRESQGEASSQRLGLEAAPGTVPTGVLLAGSSCRRKYLVRGLACCSGHSPPLGRNQLLS